MINVAIRNTAIDAVNWKDSGMMCESTCCCRTQQVKLTRNSRFPLPLSWAKLLIVDDFLERKVRYIFLTSSADRRPKNYKKASHITWLIRFFSDFSGKTRTRANGGYAMYNLLNAIKILKEREISHAENCSHNIVIYSKFKGLWQN